MEKSRKQVLAIDAAIEKVKENWFTITPYLCSYQITFCVNIGHGNFIQQIIHLKTQKGLYTTSLCSTMWTVFFADF